MALLLGNPLGIHAQTGKITVKGIITGTTGEPLIGVSISEKGNELNGTSSDFEGNYTLTVSSNATLIYSYLGYIKEEISVNGQTLLNVSLKEDNQLLDEVVVIGYGTVKKSDLTAAVSTASRKDLQADVARDLSSALQGRISGVKVSSSGGQPGAGMDIRIRGTNSLLNNTPLYIIDGSYGDINMVDPADIESMEVLKDASAAAIYGSRAANGVVLLRTKSGKKDTPSKLSVNFHTGIQSLPQKWDVITDGKQWRELMTAMGSTTPFIGTSNTDWQDAYYRTAMMYKGNVGINGGSKTATYDVSGGFTKQDGIIEFSDYQNLNLRLKNTFSFLDNKLRMGETLIVRNTRQRVQGPEINSYAALNPILMPPIMPVYDDNRLGGYAGVEEGMNNMSNPIALADKINQRYNNTSIFLNAFMEIEPIEGLTYKLNFGLNRDRNTGKLFEGLYDIGNTKNTQTSVQNSSNNSNSWTLENTINYNKTFGKHTLYALIGYSAQKDRAWGFSAFRANTQDLGAIDAGESGTAKATGNLSAFTMASYFGRIMYSFDNRYLLSGSIRRDGSSRFQKGHRWGTFPSVSAGWNVHNESFAEPIKEVVDELKIRGSFGELGNQGIGNYATQSTITSGINAIQGNDIWYGSIPFYQWTSPTNLTWEKTRTWDIGLDITMLNGALRFSSDYYIKNTKDILLNIPMPISSGLTGSPYMNAGNVENKGFEMSVTFRNNIKDFNYSISGNLSTVSNKMKKVSIGSANEWMGYTPQNTAQAVTRSRVGDPLGSFYVVKSNGIYQSREEVEKNYGKPWVEGMPDAGDVRFIDADQNGEYGTGDIQYAGSPFPDMEYGIQLSANWRGFDLGLFFDGQFGNKIYNFAKYKLESADVLNKSKRMLNYWTPTNTGTSVPRVKGHTSNTDSYTDRWLESGSYFRLKTLELGYTLPKRIVNRISIDNLRIFVSGENVFTITPYSGYTPDLGMDSSIGTVMSRGVDIGRYPSPRIISFGFQVSL